jgi:hypothetical protein
MAPGTSWDDLPEDVTRHILRGRASAASGLRVSSTFHRLTTASVKKLSITAEHLPTGRLHPDFSRLLHLKVHGENVQEDLVAALLTESTHLTVLEVLVQDTPGILLPLTNETHRGWSYGSATCPSAGQ